MPTCCWPLAKSQIAQGVEEERKMLKMRRATTNRLLCVYELVELRINISPRPAMKKWVIISNEPSSNIQITSGWQCHFIILSCALI